LSITNGIITKYYCKYRRKILRICAAN